MNEVVKTVEGAISNELSGLTLLLVSRIKYEIKLAWGFEDELKSLEKEVDELSKLLAGVCSKPITNQLMDDWLKKIKNVVYDANDLLDEWSFEVINLQISTISSSNCCDMDALIMYPISRFCMGHKIRSLRNSIISIHIAGTKLGITPIEVAAGEVYGNNARLREIEREEKLLHDKRLSASDDILIGRDDDQKKILQMLRDPIHTNTNLTVIGIVGSGGFGKTALTKRISKEEKVSTYFNSLVIWLTVSHDFDLKKILSEMVEILFKQNFNMESVTALKEKLQEKMKGKKYLLILDDVWDTTFWESFKNALHDIGGSKGSILLVTTRNKQEIESMESPDISTHIHQLEELGQDYSWSLFMKVFNDDDLAYNKNKHEIAERLVKNCGGVPLAIRALGNLLRRKKDIEDWKIIEGSEEWKKNDEYGILPSLRLSYDYLPNEALKKCFAFCAIFKEDEVISKDKLIYMWMAHGLLQLKSDRMMEQIGEDYCNVLLNSSLFQEAEMDFYGNVETFKMHDLVTSLARVVSKGECLHSSNGEYDGSTDEVVVHHLSLPLFERELTKSCCMKLQTLVHEYILGVREVRQLKECKRLRVLRIGGFLNEDFMLEFLGSSSFKHLRYLQVDTSYIDYKSSGGFEMMRRKLQNIKLYHLQTLWIGHGIPSTFIKVLLKSDLVNLRHIHCGDPIGIPEGLGRLTTLQTLSEIDLKKEWGGRISELGSLKNLRGTLKLKNVSHICSDEEDASSLFSAAGDNCHIENLHLHWGFSDVSLVPQERVLEAMQPHSNFKRLQIEKYYGRVFPTWLTETGSPLCNLVSLTLSFCVNAEGYLQMENFSCLRLLDIQWCPELRLSFPKHGFHCCKLLEQIIIIACRLVYLPDLSPLTKLRVLSCDGLSEVQGHELVGLGNLACLRELNTTYLLPADLDEHSPLCNSLQKLTIWHPPSDFHAEQLPMQLQHLKTLQCLMIDYYNVETLPEWLGNLTALRQLKFGFLKKLKWLPSQQAMQRLSNLHTFSIYHCPILKKDITSKTGEWLKIAHIPNIWGVPGI